MQELTWLAWAASATALDAPGAAPEAARTYRLQSTAPQRDKVPNERIVRETANRPRLRSGSELLDGLFALTMAELDLAAVDSISDPAYDEGRPLHMPPGGAYETGEKWNYVWTRDTAYALHLGLAMFDPSRAANALRFKLSPRRNDGAPEIVQDTGSGGSWPISSDRVSWVLGAIATLPHLPAAAADEFRQQASEALFNTLERDRIAVFDANDGLYRGEQSFLDWREQSYPSWTARDTVHLASAKALSTNVLHLLALRQASEWAQAAQDKARAARYADWANALAEAIPAGFRLPGTRLWSTLRPGELDPAPVRQFDLLGLALAATAGLIDAAQIRAWLSLYPLSAAGAPVIWPQQPNTPIYHNRAIWPFVTAYALRMARTARHAQAFHAHATTLLRGAALALSNMENFEFLSLLSEVEDGADSGPVVNSRRQLWSLGAFTNLILEGIFGLEVGDRNIEFAPWLPESWRAEFLGRSDRITLADLPLRGHRVNLSLELQGIAAAGDVWEARSCRVDGQVFQESRVPFSAIHDDVRIALVLHPVACPASTLTRVSDAREDWMAPAEPEIARIGETDGQVILAIRHGDADARLRVFRNGERVAEGFSPGLWRDTPSPDAMQTWSAEAVSRTGLVSRRAKPVTRWPWEQEIAPNDARVRHSGTVYHGQAGVCLQFWGGSGDWFEVQGLTIPRNGEYVFALRYANAWNAINTGITCGVKRLRILDNKDGETASAVVAMPHLANWNTLGESTTLRACLIAGERYRLEILDEANMSSFQHNRLYSGVGGRGGAENRIHLSAVLIRLYLGEPERMKA